MFMSHTDDHLFENLSQDTEIRQIRATLNRGTAMKIRGCASWQIHNQGAAAKMRGKTSLGISEIPHIGAPKGNSNSNVKITAPALKSPPPEMKTLSMCSTFKKHCIFKSKQEEN